MSMNLRYGLKQRDEICASELLPKDRKKRNVLVTAVW